MSRWSSWIALAWGATMVRLGATGGARNYVRPSMARWLVIFGLATVGLSIVTLLHGSDHAHRRAVALVAAIPMLVVLVVRPSALGSYLVDRNQPALPRVGAHRAYPRLPVDSQGRATITLSDLGERAAYDTGASMRSVPLRLVGFVMPSTDGGAFRLTRFQVACCAADAAALQVVVYDGHDTSPPPIPPLAIPQLAIPPRDSWVEVTATFRAGAHDRVPASVTAQRIQRIPTPAEPYE